MRRALALAARGLGRTAPNPSVGCVIVGGHGHIVGEGFHRRAGLPHAEVEALAKAGKRACGGTAYVTLEPCDHTGRTGPCTRALIHAGIARVVAAVGDPNPRVRGRGLRRLRAAGVVVETGLFEEEARELNGGFFSWITTGRPRVTLKAAVSLDGRLAASSGDSRWVSGVESRRMAHRLRNQADAVLVGAATVRVDDPELTARIPGGRDPLRVILDGKLRIPPTARVVRSGTLVVTSPTAPRAAETRLCARGAEVLRLPGHQGRVDLPALLDELGRRNVLELLVEGGGVVHAAFLAAGLGDRLVLFIAPLLIGAAGVPLIALPGGARMAEARRLVAVSTRRLGGDIMLTGSFAGR